MFRTNNCSSSGGLYKQVIVFFQAWFEESSRWHDTIYTDFLYCNQERAWKLFFFFQKCLNTKAAKTQCLTLKIDTKVISH